jgi:hypothetical protein
VGFHRRGIASRISCELPDHWRRRGDDMRVIAAGTRDCPNESDYLQNRWRLSELARRVDERADKRHTE